ncbi:MAG: alpha/beta hydrolase [Deltaproteobacteria bacterium]|nr:alpha/beta hydrolase [Deltaproteobacteria bacterium]
MSVRDLELAVREDGPEEGLPLLWGHCLLGDMGQDDDAHLLNWGELTSQTRVIRYDARGHGDSQTCYEEEAFHFSNLTQDLFALTDTLELDEFIAGGVSMGCALAIHAAVHSPERVKGLVLMAPPTAWDTRPRQAKLYRYAAHAVRLIGFFPLQFVGALSLPGGYDSPAVHLVHAMIRHARDQDRRSAVAAFRGLAASDLPPAEVLAELKQPTLILAWTGDPGHPISTAEKLVELMPHAELHVVSKMNEAQDWTKHVSEFVAAHKQE